MNKIKLLLDALRNNRNNEHKGFYSVCCTQENVLLAGMKQAKSDNSFVVIESTSNQVDQFGGYTGMKPDGFINYVGKIADKIGFSQDQIIFGGDHLGPNAWQSQNSDVAMSNAHVLIRDYVKAGYQKIHLDASMHLADDKGDSHQPLPDEVVAKRAADLCKTSEKTWHEFKPNSEKPVYIIGTEVPIPGGAQEKENEIHPTKPEDAVRTIEITKAAFFKEGLQDAWERVVGVVVQPGVEFGDDQVFDYNSQAAANLSKVINNYTDLVFEAHSTDYQTESALTKLVKDHFCILKVGPWLTFAYREALFALENIEKELLKKDSQQLSNLRATLEQVMVGNPKYWAKYYSGNEEELNFKRNFSLSDRCRYYWPDEKLKESVEKLFKNLNSVKIPISLLSQYMPEQYASHRSAGLEISADSLVEDKIRVVLGIYSRAVGQSK